MIFKGVINLGRLMLKDDNRFHTSWWVVIRLHFNKRFVESYGYNLKMKKDSLRSAKKCFSVIFKIVLYFMKYVILQLTFRRMLLVIGRYLNMLLNKLHNIIGLSKNKMLHFFKVCYEKSKRLIMLLSVNFFLKFLHHF